MQKVNQYLPTEKEIVNFFTEHPGGFGVIRITELLIQGKVNHTTPHEEEWKHVRGILYSLKIRNLLVVKNEGKQVVEELFYSTPERLDKYHNPDMNTANTNSAKTIIGVINNNGVMSIGDYTKNENIQNEQIESVWKQITIGVVIVVIGAGLLYVIQYFTGMNIQSQGV